MIHWIGIAKKTSKVTPFARLAGGSILAALLVTLPIEAAFAQAASSLQTAGAFSTVLTTLNAGFFAEGRSFTSVPSDPKVNQTGYGVWVRDNVGLFDVSSVASASIGQSSPVQTRSTFGGVQAGIDLGKFNLGGSGYNVIYGVSGGTVNVDAYATGGTGSSHYSIPFVSGYVVVSKGGFSAEASIREDLYSFNVVDPLLSLNTNAGGAATTGSISASYKYNIPTLFYVEPSIAFSASHLTIGSYFVPGGVENGGVSGILKANGVDSDLGRLGLRVGRAFTIGEVVIDPFVAASVWHEFASSNTGSFIGISAPIAIQGSTTRVGTFGQYSVGAAAALGNSGLIIFARGDLRSGSNVKGNNISGGIRYQF